MPLKRNRYPGHFSEMKSEAISMVEQIPEENITAYHSFFAEHRIARSLIDTMQIRPIGPLWVDHASNPTILLYSHFHILAGDPDSANVNEILAKILEKRLIVTPKKNWVPKMEEFWKKKGGKLHSIPRTQMDASTIKLDHIRELIDQLPPGYSLEEIDRETAQAIDTEQENYLSVFFGSLENFLDEGAGFCIKEEKILASFATAFVPFREKLEFQVVTHPQHRRKGLAAVVSAKLIEYCLERGITPCWDAANEPSIHLAKKLGYSNPESWVAYAWAKL
jgi:GNAT superfamily N-acetyltransferase